MQTATNKLNKMNSKKITIIGSGNMGLSLAKGLVKSGLYKAEAITLTRRTLNGLTEYAEQGFNTTNNNAEAVKGADIIVLAVLPQQVNKVLDEIKSSINPKMQLFTSVVSGVTCNNIKEKLYKDLEVVRVMPNTAIAIQQSMTCFATDNASTESLATVKQIFDTVGISIQIQEDLMTSATALCACGIAFFLRSIRAASQGGVEVGFHAHDALMMAAQTAKGAADLLLQLASHPEHEIDKVTSPKGCTIAGLNEMEHNGFSSAMIKGIKMSAKIAGELYTKE
ncbi:pyrroline-5-carboxylate reductase [Pedobacter arcticus]|uniref:pyrroline-5-carboxylate reductase n=1 Tax=Pedobacter arcticus TaxID=752140 RepID=UPI0021CEE1A2|nr:pyrroline-5-carboxylate reductase [Pedobacter arcticus]